MRKLFIFLMLFICAVGFSQVKIVKLDADTTVFLFKNSKWIKNFKNSDSVCYYTNQNSFRFNKDIYVKGVKLGSGGGSDVAKYLKNFSPNDTVISFVAKSGTAGMQIQSTQANQCLKLINSYMYGKGILSQVSGAESVAGYFDASGSTVNTAFGVRINSKIAIPFRIDSLNTEKFTINSSGVPKINRYVGTGNRQIVANSRGELVLGAPSSLIATQLKNYNINQDTVIRFPNLASGKFGIWENINNGTAIRVNTNNGIVGYINSNSTGGSIGWYLGLNMGGCYGWLLNSNSGTGFYLGTNNTGSVGYLIGTNIGIGSKISANTGIGYFVENTNTNTAIGVKSFAADTVSLTSGARTGIFGKTGYYTDIDGFGQLRLYRNNVLKLKIDTAGHILNNPPHAYSIDTTSNFNITLTQNVWKQVTNATKNFWSNNAELDYFSFTGDTVVLAKKGHYTGDFNINIAGASGATYEYRIIQKNGTTKIVNKFTVKGTGEIVYRNVPFYVQGIVGTKIWVEIRFTGATTGSPITVTGGLFRIFPIHLQ